MSKKKIIPPNEAIAIPIEWHIPEGQITPFATNMTVQTIGNEFKISFFEIKPPIRLDDSEPLPSKARADWIETNRVICKNITIFYPILL